MPLNALAVLAHRFEPVEQVVTDRDTMLFALSIGMGCDPLDSNELHYVYEEELKIAPTLPIVLGYPGPWMGNPSFGITLPKLVHGTQRLELGCPLRTGVVILASNRVLEVVDKGADSGAIVVVERTLTDKTSGMLLARMEQGLFCRADGGFGGQRQLSHQFRAVPDRAPDRSVELPTQPNQALWYRLNGDRNPLHASPAFAAKAGFPRPILHGLCTYSVAAHGLMKLHPDCALTSIETRFSKPVFPGETVRIDTWTTSAGVAFRATVAARSATVLDRGFAEFA
jgi:acyl dehydratase